MYKRTDERSHSTNPFRLLCTRMCTAAVVTGVLVGSCFAAPGHVTAQNGLRLRSASNTTAQVITVLPNGAALEVLEAVDDSWYRVTAGNDFGFVSSQYVSLSDHDAALGDGTEAETPPQPNPTTVYALVHASSLNVRSGPGTGYEKVTTISSGTLVVILSEQDGWYRICVGDETGYISSEYVTIQSTQQDTPSDTQDASTPPSQDQAKLFGLVSASSLNVRSGPGSDHPKVSSLSSGAQVEILETLEGWYRIGGGYVSADYITILDSELTALQAQIVAYAHNFLGYPYVLGASGPSKFDCSGLTQYVYKHFGYSIRRTATQQLQDGTPVEKENLQPGDLVFFNSAGTGAGRATHVGIYIGNGQFLHASSPKVGVVISDLYSTYYKKVYTTARRIL